MRAQAMRGQVANHPPVPQYRAKPVELQQLQLPADAAGRCRLVLTPSISPCIADHASCGGCGLSVAVCACMVPETMKSWASGRLSAEVTGWQAGVPKSPLRKCGRGVLLNLGHVKGPKCLPSAACLVRVAC